MISLAYIIPTIGRTTLARAVDGIIAQMKDVDELFVVGDGVQSHARFVMSTRRRQNVFYLEHGPTKNWGCEQIDYATQLVCADYICYLGDDDQIHEGAMEAIRAAVEQVPAMPHVFAMRHTGSIMSGSVRECQVSGQQIVVPNDKKRIPPYSFNDGHATDASFIRRVVENWNDVGFQFHDDLIAILENMNQGKYF